MELTVLELGWWMLMAVVKFLIVPSLMVARGASFLTTCMTTTAGAALGIQLFFYFGKWLMRSWNIWMDRLLPARAGKPRPIFTTGRRRTVRWRSRFGLTGLLVVSGMISVPITAMLAAKYYSRTLGITGWLSLAFAVWALVLTTVSWWVRFGTLPF